MSKAIPQKAAQGALAGQQPWQVAAERHPRAAEDRGWLIPRRAAALARLAESGLPTTDDEDWRYTSLAGYTQRWTDYLVAPTAAAQAAERASPPASTGTAIEIVDGVLRSPPPVQTGLTVQSAGPASRVAPSEDLLKYLDGLPQDSLVELNSALLVDVVLVTTEAGAQIAEPLHLQNVASGRAGFGQPRLLVDLAPGSRLTLVVEHSGAGGALVNAVTEIRLGRDSQLDLIRVQDLPDDGMLTETTRIEVGESASLTVTSVDLGSQLSRHALTASLAGAGASATVDGLFLADGRRHLDNRTRLEHRAPRTISRESFRGIADDHGRGVFNGKIIVFPGAEGSNAALTNRNLLLAATAEIDTKPELEIYVDDVRCSHGATTGQLDANALFYLRTRGIDAAAARQLLTSAFLRQGLDSISLPELRSRLDSRLTARLAGT